LDGYQYVAYVFAHNAGGFGLTGTDNVISCGSFTTDGSGNATVNLGYEPQWLLMKSSAISDNWLLVDNMRGMPVGSPNTRLFPNLSNEESVGSTVSSPTATGFTVNWGANNTYIYIAIRRGPMKVPTDGTSVFAPVATTATSNTTTGYAVTAGFPVDLSIFQFRNASFGSSVADRLRGVSNSAGTTPTIYTYSTSAESNSSDQFGADNMTGIRNYGYGTQYNLVNWMWRRAPSFMDVVCVTFGSSGSYQSNVPHNLGAQPELVISKVRDLSNNWGVYYRGGTPVPNSTKLRLNTTDASIGTSNPDPGNVFSATSTVFTFLTGSTVYGKSAVAYLFASCPGVSKVGSYTGTGATQTINCGFTAGSRFVLIKRTDSTGDWYVWDSARGIVAGNDPYLLLNSTAAEVTNTDYIDTASTGFEISSTAPAAINASGGSFIFFAVA
jgi:hypothetical protein